MGRASKTAGAGIKLGIFIAFTSIATGILAVTISNVRFGPTHTYKAMFTDVAGLLDNDDVRVAGVRVGQVESIKLRQGNPARAEVKFSLSKLDTFQNGLPNGVIASIRYRNLMGQRYLSLEEGPGAAGDYLKPGGTIPVAQTRNALDLTVLFNGFRPLFRALQPEDINKLSTEIVQTLQGEAGTVNSLLSHVASLTNTLANRDDVIGRLIDNLNNVLGTIDARHEQTNTLILQLRGFVSGVAGDRKAIFDSLAAINDLTGTTADLLNDARPSIKNDIVGLNRLTKTLSTGNALDTALKRTPDRMNKLVHASSYGSWFNFYLCGLDARIVLPGGPVMQSPRIVNDNARCK